MNERILELAQQAEMAANKGDHVDVKIMMAKFAELLIRECARVASDYDGAHYVGTAIELHFGVE